MKMIQKKLGGRLMSNYIIKFQRERERETEASEKFFKSRYQNTH